MKFFGRGGENINRLQLLLSMGALVSGLPGSRLLSASTALADARGRSHEVLWQGDHNKGDRGPGGERGGLGEVLLPKRAQQIQHLLLWIHQLRGPQHLPPQSLLLLWTTGAFLLPAA